MQVVTRLSYCFVNGLDVGRRRRGNSFRMRMPVTDKMESLSVHFVDLPLFLVTVGKVQTSRATIHGSRTGNKRDSYLMIREVGEELASGL
jgi:hypothetical protein